MKRFDYSNRRVATYHRERDPDGGDRVVKTVTVNQCYCCNGTGVVAVPALIMDEPPRNSDPAIACKHCHSWLSYPKGALDERADPRMCEAAHELLKAEAQEWLKLSHSEQRDRTVEYRERVKSMMRFLAHD